jgi:hypothetical protein
MTYGPIDFSDQDEAEELTWGETTAAEIYVEMMTFFVVLASLTKQQEIQVLSLYRRLCTKSTVYYSVSER